MTQNQIEKRASKLWYTVYGNHSFCLLSKYSPMYKGFYKVAQEMLELEKTNG
jgi:hypothetical protein